MSHQHEWKIAKDEYGGFIAYDTNPPMYDWHCKCGATQLAAVRDIRPADPADAAVPRRAQLAEGVMRIEVTREDDGQYFADYERSHDGGCSAYADTAVGALANLCALLIKVDEDAAHERAEVTEAQVAALIGERDTLRAQVAELATHWERQAIRMGATGEIGAAGEKNMCAAQLRDLLRATATSASPSPHSAPAGSE